MDVKSSSYLSFLPWTVSDSRAQESCHLAASPNQICVLGHSVIFQLRSTELPAYGQVMAIGSTTAGLLADGLVRSGMSVTRVRKLVQTIAFMVPAGASDLTSVHATRASA